MQDISRRQMIALTGAAVVVAAIPTVPATAAVTPAPVDLKAWAVGTPGDFDWEHIVAETQEAAKRWFAAEKVGGEDYCEEGGAEDCDCEFCCVMAGIECERKPMWDGKANLTSADWLRGGLGTLCDRCSYETFAEDNGHIVGDQAVCDECVTLEEWDKIDPDRAASMRRRMTSYAIMGRD